MPKSTLKHLGIIMDGNRRWARKHGILTGKGHEAGSERLIDLAIWCIDEGIPYLSVYAFSTENWRRSQKEVSDLFSLMEKFFVREISRCLENGIRVRISGNHSLLGKRPLDIIRNAENQTKHCDKLCMRIALSYGGRDEIIRAAKAIAEEAKNNHIDPSSIDEDMFQTYLDTPDMPDIDMVIRTGGYRRLSNFFPWQSAYAELYFMDTLWPDFSKTDLTGAIEHYNNVSVNKGR